jgi:hypothetical protein
MCVVFVGSEGCFPDTSSEPTAQCNDLLNNAPEVESNIVVSAAPVAKGGTISPGIYALSGLTIYAFSSTSSSTPTIVASAVIEIKGSTMQQVGSIDGVESRYISTFRPPVLKSMS